MNISMDGLRLRLISDYNSLTKKLNNSIIKDAYWDPEIIINPLDIEKEMDAIRNAIVTLAFCYINGEFESMSENTYFEYFNPNKS